jgi:hypothetical protein
MSSRKTVSTQEEDHRSIKARDLLSSMQAQKLKKKQNEARMHPLNQCESNALSMCIS